MVVKGQLSSPEEFAAIVLRANPDGSTVTIGDVARVEIGAREYQYGTRLNGKPATAFSVQLSPGANAMETATLVRAKMQDLARYFPEGVKYDIPYDTSPFVKVSIEQVINTLFEAMLLVFAVMFLFLQNLRYTLIPTLVVPVALMGTFAVMLAMGFSVNVLTLFGMVLAIGIWSTMPSWWWKTSSGSWPRKACRPSRPRARPWARSAARSSVLPRCWWRCSCPWPSCKARWG